MKLDYTADQNFELDSCYANDSVEAAIQKYGYPTSFIYGKDDTNDMVLLIYSDKFIAAGYDGEYQHILVFDK